MRKAEEKWTLSANDLTLYVENSRESTKILRNLQKKLLELVNGISKAAG